MKLEEVLKLTKADLKGKIICFATDTVYGVGCMIDDEEALEKIYQLKHRDPNKPIATLVPSEESIQPYVLPYPKEASIWMEKYWPGALTIIFNKQPGVCDKVVRGRSTIGFRMPNSKVALAILNHFGPMATTSVNISNQPPMNDLTEIKQEFGDQIDIIVEEKETCSKVSSTIVDVTKTPYTILRDGDIKLF